MGQRGHQDWSHEPLPVGTVRIRQHSKRSRVRMIKVRDDGPKGRRWMTLARHWWLTNRGPIPPGKRVVHRNGDLLDDRPENYILATGGDVAYLARLWDPKLESRCERRRLPAIREHNRLRSRIRRALGYLPEYWYAVDITERIVINDPRRSRLAILRAWAGQDVRTVNGAGIFGAWLGWPDAPDLGAFVLAALAIGPLSFADLKDRANSRRCIFGLPEASDGAFFQVNTRLKHAGLLEVIRQPGRLPREYRITQAGSSSRANPCPWIPCLGKDLAERFHGFIRTLPKQGALTQLAHGSTPRRKDA